MTMTTLTLIRRRIFQKQCVRRLFFPLSIVAIIALTYYTTKKLDNLTEYIQVVTRDYNELANELEYQNRLTQDCNNGDCGAPVISTNQSEDINKETPPDISDGNQPKEMKSPTDIVNDDEEQKDDSISDVNPPKEMNASGEVVQNAENYIMIGPPLGSRMGNLMFDFACSLGIARSLGYKYLLRNPGPLPNFCELPYTRVRIEQVTNVLNITQAQWKNETFRNSNVWIGHNLTLIGHHRMWKDFRYSADEVHNSLTFLPQFLKPALEFLRNSIPKNCTVIGVHVRRGDFLTEESIGWGRTVADISYIRKAMNFYRNRFSNAFFVVASDDKPWVKENLDASDTIFSPFDTPAMDMAVLNHCNHSVITSGTFGWWSAWLTNGTVVYFKGFPKPGSRLEEEILFKDEFYPPHWIGMDNGEEEEDI